MSASAGAMDPTGAPRSADYERAWSRLRMLLKERYEMAREVLEQESMGHMAALIPIEEVLVWMDEEEGRTDDQ